ncbi:MAG: metal ABC transporter permease [Spirochaetes bacterium]|nr:metal ABC transporter permease [Spirochaetota bacterium]
MGEFFSALVNPDITFLRYALLIGLLGSVSFGIVGTYVVTRRISYIAGAIAHSALGGIGAGLYLQANAHIRWFSPTLGAVLSALAAGAFIGFVSIYAKQREDTVIGTIWAIGMASGLILFTRTPGYIEPMSYLFGNILLISKSDLLIVAALDIVVILTGAIFYNKFLAVCFDEEFVTIRGARTVLLYLLLICLTSLTVVLMVTVVGIVMVIALLTVPAAVSGLFSKKLWQMMIFSCLLCMVFTTLGLGMSYSLDLPTGSNIILLAGAVYLLAVGGTFILRRKRH